MSTATNSFLLAHGIKVDPAGFVFGWGTRGFARILKDHGLRDDRAAWVAEGPFDVAALADALAREIEGVLS